MRILYAACDQRVPGTTGGSVHVLEVARGLAARGHEVHTAVRGGGTPATEGGVRWHAVEWFPPHRFFRFRATSALVRLGREVRPDVVMERYYNFGGEGVRAAEALGIPSLLEVNSPVLDHPGSLKAWLDAALLVRPLRRYREGLCRRTAALVAPLLEIVPPSVRDKTVSVTWGANVDAFRPAPDKPALRRRLGLPLDAVIVVFAGSFRPWHGVHVLEAAARRLRERRDVFFVLAGGPERGSPSDYHGRRLGRVPYEEMPDVIAAADVGVAPYDTTRLAQLRLGFYWSPLKIFESMACGLPTLTIPRPPLTELLRDGVEGLFFREADPEDLARQLLKLADDASLRCRLGASARERVVERYSWARHCEQLETVLEGIAA